MEHLGKISGLPGTQCPLRTPLTMDTPEWDRIGKFTTFPELCGIQIDDNGQIQFVNAEYVGSLPVDSFVQRWLYFELLREVFGTRFNEEDFVDESGQYITTTKLEAYLTIWKDEEVFAKQKNDKKQIQRLLRIQKALDFAREIVSRYCAATLADEDSIDSTSDPTWSNVDPRIILSILVLGETLTRANIRVQEAIKFNIEGWHNHDLDTQGWGYSTIALDFLRELWCRPKIKMLQSLFKRNTIGLLYAARYFERTGNHRLCTGLECRAYDDVGTEDGGYTPAHAPGCNKRDCVMVSVDSSQLAKTIYRGNVPLLRYTPGDTKPLEIVEMTNWNKPYVIFSHVWTDRFGNISTNSMRSCVLDFFDGIFEHIWKDKTPGHVPPAPLQAIGLDRRMSPSIPPQRSNTASGRDFGGVLPPSEISARTVTFDARGSAGQVSSTIPLKGGEQQPTTKPHGRRRSISKGRTTLFWIDTLAIPVSPEHRDARKAVIARMHEIYTHAKHTVVLDKGLMNASREQEYANQAMRITMSKWMTRLWTLQEAVLSKSLYFQFKNETFALEDLEAQFEQEDTAIHTGLPAIARAYYHGILGTERYRLQHPDMKKERYITNPNFVSRVWIACQWRVTTHLQHETLALATLLNVATEPFVDADHSVSRLTRRGSVNISSSLRSDRGNVQLDERMTKLLQELAGFSPCAIPAGMIFLPGPRIPIEGFGWAPRTWLSSQDVPSSDALAATKYESRLTPAGLEVQYPGFILHDVFRDDNTFKSRTFSFPVNSMLSEWYRVQKLDPKEPCPARKSTDDRQLAIIAVQLPLRAKEEIALLVLITKKRPILIEAEVMARVMLSREIINSRIEEYKGNFGEMGPHSMFCGEQMHDSQRWCVDGPRRELVRRWTT